MWLKYGLKAQKFLALGNGRKQRALKGQKLLAQGIALGIMAISKSPCTGQLFIYLFTLLPLKMPYFRINVVSSVSKTA